MEYRCTRRRVMIYAESEFKHSIWVCYQCIPYCVKVGGFKLRAASSLECERVVVTLATENDNVVPSLCLLSVWLPSEDLLKDEVQKQINDALEEIQDDYSALRGLAGPNVESRWDFI